MKKILVLLTALVLFPSALLLSGCSAAEDITAERNNVIANFEQIETGWTDEQVRNVMQGNMPIVDSLEQPTYMIYAYDFDNENEEDDFTIYITLTSGTVTTSMIVYGLYTWDIANFQ